MFLRRITICGFKSFSNKVDFDFGPGVTCVVGPNGCGKSNVVDAFRWVLGEQSARSLRGRQMTDMIFSGSSTRPSSSLAQVDLVFNNADRTLPMDCEEVTITRKLYRSGESEYLLNQESMRLKDIRELFLDTGVGVDAYSVIEQGRVDSLLQSNPNDRRAIFEEAAGISRYKARRKEAERKLDRTQQNLLRVSDIIEELEKRLRSVKLQAGKARSYRTYETRLNELRSAYAMAEYDKYADQIDRLTHDAQEAGDAITAIRTTIDSHEANEAQITSRLDRLADQINAADSDFIQAKSELLAQQERIEAAQDRVEEQKALLDRANERRATDAHREEEARSRLNEVQVSAKSLQDETRSLHARVEEFSLKDRSLARELTEAQAILEDEKSGIIDLLRKSAQLHNEIIHLNTQRESLVGQKGRLSQRGSLIRTELETSLEQKARFELRVRKLDTLIEEETRNLEDKKTETARARELEQSLSAQLASAKEAKSALQSRRELLEDLQQRMEGVGPAARRLMDRRHDADAPPGLEALAGLVADILETDVQHARVVEAALGSATQYLVITDSHRFLDSRDLWGDLPGQTTTICLDRIPPMINERDFSDQPGFVARATDLVRVPDEFEGLARHLLGKTIVVDTLNTALSLAARDVAGHRFVTGQGEVVEPDGRVRLGRPSAAAGLISRKSELRDIADRADRTDKTITTLADQLNRTQAERDHLEGVQQELRNAIYESNTARVEASTASQSIAENIQRLTNEQPVIANEVTLLEQEINEVLRVSEEGGKSLEAVESENKRREETVADHQARIDAVVASRLDVQEALTRAKIEVGQLTEKRAAAAETINALRRTLHDLEEAIAGAKHDVEQVEARQAQARDVATKGRERLGTLQQRIQEHETTCTEFRRQRETLRLESESLSQAVKTARTRLATADAELHEIQMSLAEANVRRDDLTARVKEELNIDLEELCDRHEHEDQNWEEVESEIAELRAKMDRLGNVNLDAIAELEGIEARHAFLTAQRDDLDKSHRQLTQLIEKLNSDSRQRFIATFDEIRDNFRALFRKLFGGGRADIILEDPANVLECGIEILAQPPGKELQSISLMSGGEKSLTAIALLMSIFKTRPAPCAFLDEVDAALDEANNERFNRIIREFVSEAQFIIITHSKWTMNMADRLYGITMQEPGVSTRVSVEFTGVNVA